VPEEEFIRRLASGPAAAAACPLVTDGKLLTSGRVLQVTDVMDAVPTIEDTEVRDAPCAAVLTDALTSWLVNCTSYTGPSGFTFSSIVLLVTQTHSFIQSVSSFSSSNQ